MRPFKRIVFILILTFPRSYRSHFNAMHAVPRLLEAEEMSASVFQIHSLSITRVSSDLLGASYDFYFSSLTICECSFSR